MNTWVASDHPSEYKQPVKRFNFLTSDNWCSFIPVFQVSTRLEQTKLHFELIY